MIAAVRLLARATITRGRVLGLAAIGAFTCLIGVIVRLEETATPESDAFGMIDGFALTILVPVVAAVLGAAALGDPSEDGTLVYLWMRPVARWRLAVAGLAAALVAGIPLAVGPTVLAAAFTGVGRDLVLAAAVASTLAVAAYAGIFVALGLKVRRALAWGMAYVVVWEGVVSRVGTPAARLSVAVYARSILARWTDQELPQHAASTPVAVIVLAGVAVAGVAVATLLFTRTDVQ